MSPALVARMECVAREVAADWGLVLGPRIASGRYSYVAPAGDDAILKVVPPEDDDADHIADALELWHGAGAVRLLRHDPARRALLLERLHPGTELAAVADDGEATRIAISVATRIWRAPTSPHPFRTVAQWVERWLPAQPRHDIVREAQGVFASMRPRAAVVVHHDFHHHNILRRGDEWVVIDPKPFLGEPEFDVPPFLANPFARPATRERTLRRIGAFVAAGLDGERIRQWAIVRGALEGEPGTEPETDRMRVARWLV
jgi:streptomycin 6-kinase